MERNEGCGRVGNNSSAFFLCDVTRDHEAINALGGVSCCVVGVVDALQNCVRVTKAVRPIAVIYIFFHQPACIPIIERIY